MKELLTQLKGLWDKMDTTRRIIAAVVLILVLGIIIFVVTWTNAPRYELLYSNLNEKDRSDIITQLEDMGIPYRISVGGVIEVPNSVSVRANLLKAGIPSGGVIGWEVFDQSSFSSTDFSNEINRQRAISGELTRTLQRVEGVIDAKILLNLPDASQYLFAEDKPEGTASIQLQLRSPGVLSQSQVEAIVNMAAAAIGVKADNITIIDNYANDLTALMRARKGTKLGVNSISDAFQAKTNYENLAQQRVESMLTKIFGFNRAVVRINADLDLDYQELKSETFGQAGVPRSEQERNESYEGTGNSAIGIPGTDSNITQYKALDELGDEYSGEKSERTVNYEINKVEEFRIVAPGKVKRLSVGVWVDGDLPAATRQKVFNTVAAAVGIVEERGDQLTVESINFTRPDEPTATVKAVSVWQMVVVALLLAGFIFGIWSVLKRVMGIDQKAKEDQADLGGQFDTLVDGSGQLEQAAMLELTTEDKLRLDRINQLEKFAMEHPDEVAALLQSWLSEDY